MFKTTIFSLFLLLTFSSCSDDSPSDSIAGDYTGEFLCVVLPETVKTDFDNVSVSAVTEVSFTIDLGISSFPITGTIDETNDIEIDAYTGSIDGVELEFSGGSGQFVRDMIVNTTDPMSTLIIRLTKVIDGTDCILTLVEKI